MITEALESAIDNGESLRVRYFGGSTPGGGREIQPISLKDGKVRARCLESGETKTFVVDKMELAVDGTPSLLASTMSPSVVACGSIDEFFTNQAAVLQALGWVVQRKADDISLHRTFKNGKVIQTADIVLQYQAIAYDIVFDGENDTEVNNRERQRPWIVRARGQTTRTYSEFGKAQIIFLEFAKSLSPLVAGSGV